jgi:prepilin-type N-terminal cleavage/methylation domain-containing protein
MKSKAFTLIELLTVLMIITILVMLVYSGVSRGNLRDSTPRQAPVEYDR